MMSLTVTFLFVFFGLSLCCEINNKEHVAICYSVTTAFAESRPEWIKLEIRNTENLALSHLNRRAFKKTHSLSHLVIRRSIKSIGSNTLQDLKKLQTFELYHNNIPKLPGTLFKDLPELLTIYLIGNGIKSFEPGTFQDLEKLRSFHLINNTIKIFPAEVISSSNLVEVTLENNGIESIENLAFVNMPKLKRINFIGNKLSSFDVPNLFGSNSLRLDRIWFGKNNLKIIKRNTLALLPNLRYLSLDNNQISEIESCAFNNLQKLVSLDLANNHLTSISPEVFPEDDMENLEIFLLHNNKLTSIEKEVLQKKSKLKYVTYYGNPLQCSCYQEMVQFLENKRITQVCDDNEEEERPTCVSGKSKCNYNENPHLYEEYLNKMKNYKPWNVQCPFADGYENIYWSLVRDQ